MLKARTSWNWEWYNSARAGCQEIETVGVTAHINKITRVGDLAQKNDEWVAKPTTRLKLPNDEKGRVGCRGGNLWLREKRFLEERFCQVHHL